MTKKFMKKRLPAEPLRHPDTGEFYPPPATQDEWQQAADLFTRDRGLPFEVKVAFDGLMVEID